MKDVVIFGAGGLGCLVLDTLLQTDRYRPVAFLDNDTRKHGAKVDGLPVLGNADQIPRLRKSGIRAAIVAIGDNEARVEIAKYLESSGIELASAIHPSASIAPSARLGKHLIVGSRVTICVHSEVSDHCVLLAGTIVEHDNKLGRGVFLHAASRLAGTVTVEDYAVVGIGACVIPGRKIGRGASVGPGAVVIRDVSPGTRVNGAPAVTTDNLNSHFLADRVTKLSKIVSDVSQSSLSDQGITQPAD